VGLALAHRGVPEGSGVWEECSRCCTAGSAPRPARSRQLAHSLARSRQAGRALPYGVAILDAEYRIVGATIPAKRISASAPKPMSATRSPISCASRNSSSTFAAGEFLQASQLKTTRDGLVLSVQFVPYVDSQRLMLSRDITQGTPWRPCAATFVANVSHELRTPLTVLVGSWRRCGSSSSIRNARATT